MEKSLSNIEKSLSKEGGSGGRGGRGGGDMAGGINSIAMATAIFDSTKGKELVSFTTEMTKALDAVNPVKAKAFGEFAEGVSKAIETIIATVSPSKLIKLVIGTKILFGGKNPLLKRIIGGISDAFVDTKFQTTGKGKSTFGDVAEGMGKVLNTIIEMVSPSKLLKLVIGSKILFSGKTPLLEKIVGGIAKTFQKLNPKKIKEGGEAIEILGDGLKSLAKSLGVLALLGAVAPLVAIGVLLAWSTVKIFSYLGAKHKEIKEGANAMTMLGKGLVAFSAGLATLMLVVLIVSPKKIIAGIALLVSFALLFYFLGKVERGISDGGKAIGWMGLGLFAFSAALALFMMVVLIAKPANIALGVASIVLLAGAFALIGKLDSKGYVKDGAKSLMEMGGALAVFSLGLLVFGVSLKLLSMIFKGDIIAAGVATASLLLGLGGVFSLIGMMSKGGSLEQGAAGMVTVGFALISIGAGILIFGLALKAIMSLFKNDWQTAALASAGIILGLGVAFALIGTQSIFITTGAAAMISVGFALMSISGGILLFGLAIKGLQAIFGDNLIEAGKIAGGILLGLGLAFAGIGALSFIITPGAAAGILMGLSLLSLSLGIWTFGNTIKGLYDKNLIDKEGKMKGVGILSQLMSEFSSMFFSSVFALPGIGIGIGMGISLMTIAKGLSDVGNVLAKLNPDTIVGTLFGENGIITKLTDNFSKLGSSGGSLVGFLRKFTGTDAVSMGIQSVRSIGNVLSELAGGIAAFGNIASFPVKVVKGGKLVDGTVSLPEVIKSINENVPTMLTSLSDVFRKIGEGDLGKFGGGIAGQAFSMLAGLLGDDPVSRGIKSVHGIGSVLSELAGGIAAFGNVKAFPTKKVGKDGKLTDDVIDLMSIIPTITETLSGNGKADSTNTGMLYALSAIFSTIGEKFGDKGFLGPGSTTQKGVDAVKGIGNVISELAGGITAFANFKAFPIKKIGKDGKEEVEYKDISGDIKGLFTSLIGSKSESGLLTVLADVFGSIGKTYGDKWFKNGDVKKGTDAVKGISDVVSTLATGITGFANLSIGLPLYDKDGKVIGRSAPIKISDIQANITDIANSLPAAFKGLDFKYIEKQTGGAKIVLALADVVSKIGQALAPLMVTMKKGATTMLKTLGTDIKAFSESLGSTTISEDKLAMLNSLIKPLTDLSNLDKGLERFAQSLSATGSAFGVFGRGFSEFYINLAKFDRFEQSFSNLLKSQYTYRFDKFSDDMGKFKDSVNKFDVEKLKLTESMIKSIAIISKAPDSMKNITETLEKSFDELIQAIRELTDKTGATSVTAPVEANSGGILDKAATAVGNMFSGKPQATTPAVTSNETLLAMVSTGLNGIKTELQALNSKIKNEGSGLIVA